MRRRYFADPHADEQACGQNLYCDTGSVDKTKEIAREFTDEVYDFLWKDDFSAARNFITEKADTDYWMWLDADDVITPENQEKLLRLKESMDSDTDVVMMDYAVGFDEWEHVTFLITESVL